MDLSVDEYIDSLFGKGSGDLPADSKRPPEELELPPWFDEKKFKQGLRFYQYNRFAIITGKLFGLIAVFAVPSILSVLVGTSRSSSVFTSYKRYMATFLLILSWFDHDLKPGSVSWRTLQVTRTRHFKASLVTKAKNIGVVSQRDMALTMYALFGYPLLHPEKMGVVAREPGDWEAFAHAWRTFGYMLGMDDRYTVCRKTMTETREVLKAIEKRVYVPCLHSVPEYYEHMTRVMLDGMWNIHPMSEPSAIWFTKWLSGVPGYVYFENERIDFQKRIVDKLTLAGKSLDEPINLTEFTDNCAVEGLTSTPQYVYLRDYDTLSSVPSYKQLTWYQRRKVDINMIVFYLNNFAFFRFFFALYLDYGYFTMKYIPWYATFKYGMKAFVNMFHETPTDDTKPLPNEVFYAKKHDSNTKAALRKAGLAM